MLYKKGVQMHEASTVAGSGRVKNTVLYTHMQRDCFYAWKPWHLGYNEATLSLCQLLPLA